MKKIITLLLGSLLFTNNSFAHSEETTNEKTVIAEDAEQEIYFKVEKKAEFNGGLDGLRQYLVENMKYPSEAIDKGWQGTAFVSFTVKKDGSIDDVAIVRSTTFKVLDEEAIRVVKAMPNWIPAQIQNKAVNTKFQLPVAFKLR